MRPYDFDRFLAMFTQAGRDLDAQNKQGQTLDQLIKGFQNHSAEFIELLDKHRSAA